MILQERGDTVPKRIKTRLEVGGTPRSATKGHTEPRAERGGEGGTDEYETRARVIGPEMNLASLDVKSVIAARGNPQFASGLHGCRFGHVSLFAALVRSGRTLSRRVRRD